MAGSVGPQSPVWLVRKGQQRGAVHGGRPPCMSNMAATQHMASRCCPPRSCLPPGRRPALTRGTIMAAERPLGITAQEVQAALQAVEEVWEAAKEVAIKGRTDRAAHKLLRDDDRNLGRSGRCVPPGEPLPPGLPVGCRFKSRAHMKAAGLCRHLMHGIEVQGGMAVTVFAGGNYGNRLLPGALEDKLGVGYFVYEGQGGQQQNNGKQVKSQSSDARGNAGMRAAQGSGQPVRVFLKVEAPNDRLREQYNFQDAGLFQPGQDPMPAHELYIRGETGAKRENAHQLEVTKAFWAGSLRGASHMPDLCSKCLFVCNHACWPASALAPAERHPGGSEGSSNGTRRRGRGSTGRRSDRQTAAGLGSGGKAAFERTPNIVCSSCGEAEICSTCLPDEEYARLRESDEEEWLCAACAAGGPDAAAAAGIPCMTAPPGVITAYAAAAAAAVEAFEAEVAAGLHDDESYKQRCRQELQAAEELWRGRLRGLGRQRRRRQQQQQQQQQQQRPEAAAAEADGAAGYSAPAAAVPADGMQSTPQQPQQPQQAQQAQQTQRPNLRRLVQRALRGPTQPSVPAQQQQQQQQHHQQRQAAQPSQQLEALLRSLPPAAPPPPPPPPPPQQQQTVGTPPAAQPRGQGAPTRKRLHSRGGEVGKHAAASTPAPKRRAVSASNEAAATPPTAAIVKAGVAAAPAQGAGAIAPITPPAPQPPLPPTPVAGPGQAAGRSTVTATGAASMLQPQLERVEQQSQVEAQQQEQLQVRPTLQQQEEPVQPPPQPARQQPAKQQQQHPVAQAAAVSPGSASKGGSSSGPAEGKEHEECVLRLLDELLNQLEELHAPPCRLPVLRRALPAACGVTERAGSAAEEGAGPRAAPRLRCCGGRGRRQRVPAAPAGAAA
ncbi:hypothetical protein ABPG75_012543 [Micractinium tetrahymenae]